MRNSEAQKYARWSALLALALAFIVVAVYLRRSWVAREIAKAAPPSVPAAVEQQSAKFSFSKVTGQRIVFTVRASRQTEFKEDDRNLLEDVSIDIFGPQGDRHDTMRTQACDFMSSTGKIVCAGDVQIDLQGASASQPNAREVEVQTSHVTFDRSSGKTQTSSPVTFRWPGGEGRATGAEYDSDDGTLHLNHDVQMSITPQAKNDPQLQSQPLQVNGASMLFDRNRRILQILGDVHAQQATRELSAEAIQVELDAKLQARSLTASAAPQGQARLRDTSNQAAMEVTADEIYAALTPTGAVTSVVGRGNVQGSSMSAAAQNNLQAGRVKVDFNSEHNVPRLMTADGGVVLRSVPARQTGTSGNAGDARTVQTSALEVHFVIDSRTPGMLQSVNTLAPATVEWRSVAVSSGTSTPQTLRMRGQSMNMTFAGQNQLQQVSGSGGVEVTRQIASGPQQTTNSRDLTAKFDKGEWAEVDQIGNVTFRDATRSANGDHAHLDRPTDTLTLSGSVLVNDAMTRTTAQSAAFAGNSNEFRADGRVLTTDEQTGPGVSAAPGTQAMHISGEHLAGNSRSGQAIYSGNCRFWQGGSQVEADKMNLDNHSQAVVAEGHVRGVFPQASASPTAKSVADVPAEASKTGFLTSGTSGELWHISGERLTYWSSESRARLEQQARARSKENSIDADQIDLHFAPTSNALDGRQLSSALATGAVKVRQGDRQGTADSAAYTAADGKFVLFGGEPTVYDASGDTINGRELTFFFGDDKIVVDSGKGSRTVTLHRVEK